MTLPALVQRELHYQGEVYWVVPQLGDSKKDTGCLGCVGPFAPYHANRRLQDSEPKAADAASDECSNIRGRPCENGDPIIIEPEGYDDYMAEWAGRRLDRTLWKGEEE